MEAGTSARTHTMEAAVLTGAGKLRIDRVPIPSPGPGQVRIRLEGCGVCASNLTPWAGPDWMEFPTAPGALGHEGWGIVDCIGANVGRVSIGDRVAALSFNAYATHDIAEESAVIHLPQDLDGRPFPGEPLGCAINIFQRSAVKEGETVAVVGIGFLGTLLVQLCRSAGAHTIALSRRSSALEFAKSAGATQTIAMDDHWRIIDQVKALTNGRLCQCVIEATGKQWPLDLAAELTGERGRLIIAGYHQDGPRQINMQLWNWRGLDVINAHERDPAMYIHGMRGAINAVRDGRLQPWRLYTHYFPLEKLDEALNMTRDRPGGFLKALVIYP